MPNNRDADFSPSVREIISIRSGYRCAFLDCDQSTVGPGSKSVDTENHGVVGHIYSSAPKGPRGTGGLSSEQRASPMNGILLCAIHSRVVDIDKGKNYSASLLQSWKALHESKISKEMKNLPLEARSGWIKGITVINSPLFVSGEKIDFGKVTLIFGLNGTGKTALCEWLTSTSGQVSLMERWNYRGNSEHVRIQIEYRNPDAQSAEVIFRDRTYSCTVGGKSVESLRHAYRVIYVRSDDRNNAPKNEVEFLAYKWGVHPFQVAGVLSKMGSEKYGFVRKAEVRKVKIDEEDLKDHEENEGDEPGTELKVYAQIGGHKNLFSFSALSGREQGQVVLIGAMILAEELSEFRPTMLIVELSGTSFPNDLVSEYAERLAGAEFQFQTILISPDFLAKVNWTGWSIARLEGNTPSVKIHQNDIFRQL